VASWPAGVTRRPEQSSVHHREKVMSTHWSQESLPAALLFEDLDQELASTRRMLERVPDDKGDWRPHEKSGSLAELATHVADLAGLGVMILETEELDALARPPRQTLRTSEEMLARFDQNVQRLRAALDGTDAARFEGEWTLRAGERVFAARPRRSLLRTMVLSHIVHHRAQLGVYLRLLDVPVPGMYGPSADEGFGR
jgi:uncharacterized damage-inducible protein DinB